MYISTSTFFVRYLYLYNYVFHIYILDLGTFNVYLFNSFIVGIVGTYLRNPITLLN